MVRRITAAAAVGVVVLALSLGGCGLLDDDSPVVERDPVASPYSGPMQVDASTRDRASVMERSGAAGQALECDYPPSDGGAGDYGDGLESVQNNPADALGNWLDQESVDLPQTGYVIEREDDGRALLSYDVDGRTKIAVIAAGDIRDYEDDTGWGVESWARCDPAELPAAEDGDSFYDVWTDADGHRVPTSQVRSLPGPEHCDWQDITFLYVGPDPDPQQYLRDTTDELADVLRTTYADHAVLPEDTKDTGFQHNGQELWLQPGDPNAAYLVDVEDSSHVERWPATKKAGVACA